jgi:hypothetical protein
MTSYVGTNLYVAFGGTVLQADYRSFEPEEEMGVEDGSAGADVARTYKTTLKDGNASMTLRSLAGTAGTARWVNLAVGGEGTLEWGPEGTATGKIKGSVNAILTKRSAPNEYDQVAEWSYEWQYSGAVTYSTY